LRTATRPFSPQHVAEEFSATLKEYGCTSAEADRYAGDWVVDAFAKHGVRIEPCAKNRSELYLELLPLITAGQVELLDDQRLLGQLCRLERRVGRVRDVVALGWLDSQLQLAGTAEADVAAPKGGVAAEDVEDASSRVVEEAAAGPTDHPPRPPSRLPRSTGGALLRPGQSLTTPFSHVRAVDARRRADHQTRS
jgi:hypothetical protein